MSGTLPKLNQPLPPLLPRLELDAAGTTLLNGVADAATALTKLEEAGRMAEALRLLAHALPKREAVWWASMCARSVPDPELTPADLAAVEAAESWVRRPEEAVRRAAMDAAQKTSFRSPEAWAAVGAFWSGGSMAPPEAPVVPPAEHLTGVAIAGAIMLAAVRSKPERMEARYRNFLASGRDIAAGGAGRIAPETE